MGGLLTTLKENWDVIADAPLAFMIWTIVLLGICWAILSYIKRHQIGDLKSRLSLRDDEIADLKRKLQGASPDEAGARVDRDDKSMTFDIEGGTDVTLESNHSSAEKFAHVRNVEGLSARDNRHVPGATGSEG